MQNHFKEIVDRENQALENFIENVMEQFTLSRDEALKVFDVFREVKAIKLDRWMGRWKLSHGAFWEPEVIARAIADRCPCGGKSE
jgi:hypothetical protein